jgi:membrane protease YdiL (CAAX protease family)
LLLLYEGSVVYLGGADPDVLRNGADSWLHGGLGAFGLQELYWPPALLIAGLLGWAWLKRSDQPKDLVGVCSGMVIESIFAALALWALSRGIRPVVHSLGLAMRAMPPVQETSAALVTYIGAGIYEEVLFRLLLFGALCWLLRLSGLPEAGVLLGATAAAALAFAAAHHVGPWGEPFDGYVFIFRATAGLYFTLLYRFRGLGIAIGTHACYDIFVGTTLG